MATRDGVVVAGGLVSGDASTAHTYRLDLSTGRVSPLPDLPVPVHDVGGSMVRGGAEVIGGGNATEQDVIQRLDPHGEWRVIGHLPGPRSDLVAARVGSRTFVVGGYDGTMTALPGVLLGNPDGSFRDFARLRIPVRYPAVAVAAGAIWVLGGERAGVEVGAIQRIDLNSGEARVVGQLPRPLGHASAISFGRRILLVGGRLGASGPTTDMWWFQPSSGSFRRAGALPVPLADAAIIRVGAAAYLVGGETPALSDRVIRLSLSAGP